MVNAPSQLGWVLWSARFFLSTKIKERIVMASDLLAAGSSVCQDEMAYVADLVGSNCLPASFGGTLESGALSPSWWTHCQQAEGAAGVAELLSTAEELGMDLR